MDNIQNNNELEDFLTKIDDQIILLGEPSILSEKSLKELLITLINQQSKQPLKAESFYWKALKKPREMSCPY